jgi:hypothetical protein
LIPPEVVEPLPLRHRWVAVGRLAQEIAVSG